MEYRISTIYPKFVAKTRPQVFTNYSDAFDAAIFETKRSKTMTAVLIFSETSQIVLKKAQLIRVDELDKQRKAYSKTNS